MSEAEAGRTTQNVVVMLRERRARYLAEVAKIDAAIVVIEAIDPASIASITPRQPSRTRSDASNDIASLEAAAEKILRENGQPMRRGALARKLAAAGVTVHAIDPAKYIGTVLWRNQGRFMNVAGQGFWPRDAVLA